MMIYIDENFSIADAIAHLAQTLKTGAIGGHNTIKLLTRLRLLPVPVAIEKFIFIRDAILVPDGDLFSLVAQGEGQGELRTDAITVGPDVAHDAKGLMLPEDLEDPVNNLWMDLHVTRLPPNDGEPSPGPTGNMKPPEAPLAEFESRAALSFSPVFVHGGSSGLLLDLLDDLEHAVSANNGIIHHKFQRGGEF